MPRILLCLTAVLCTMLAVACTSADDSPEPVHSESEAMARFWAHVDDPATDITREWGSGQPRAEEAGGGYWFVYWNGPETLGGESYYLVSDEGSVLEPTTISLGYLFRRRYSGNEPLPPRQQMIEEFVRLHATGDTFAVGTHVRLISDVRDIPGYQQNPMPEDLEHVVRPAWQRQDEHRHSEVTVVYAWQELGGVVRRYEFIFNRGIIQPRHAGCFPLAERVGDFTMRE